jgi:hypothetical protein
MLDPAARLIYLDELRPPAGYRLDRAVVTTYSLDLMSLLMAPLSMAMLDARRDSEGRLDPVGALEALRRTADRFVVFCQKGRISVPSQQQLLYGCLEPAVIESAAPNGGAFHPKTWLLRFEPEDDTQPVRYRFLCLSRNLTFDRSWDTALTLEGDLIGRRNAYSRNRPLSNFISALPGMASEGVPDKAREHVAVLADEVLRVRFAVPDGFQDDERDDLIFQPYGIGGRQHSIPEVPKRFLVVSPFLSDGWLRKGVQQRFPSETTLVSRTDSLDALSEKTYREIVDSGMRLFAVTDMVESAESDEEQGADESQLTERASGLHAKMYAVEQGWDGVQLWTGSANATDAAFSGTNVEFLVGLRWPRKQKGIETLLGEPQPEDTARRHGAATLADLLVPYERVSREEDAASATRRRLEQELESARASLCAADLSLSAVAGPSGYWELHLNLADDLLLPETTEGCCLPVSFDAHESRELAALVDSKDVTFSGVPTHCLTRFIGFHLTASSEGETVRTAFVLKIRATGFPEDRDSHVLRAIVQNREGFLRILLLILMDEETGPGTLATLGEPGSGTTAQFLEALGIPLFEELVRASSRHPAKITRISELLDELTDNGKTPEIVPEDFRTLWRVFAEHSVQRKGGDGDG